MPNILEFLNFEHDNEHGNEHDITLKKKYSLPKIYTANGNLKKRWYVYFSYRNPTTEALIHSLSPPS